MLVQEAIDEVRMIASDLHPHYLDRLGLKAALETIIDKVSHSTAIEFTVSIGDVRDVFPKNVEINLYRIMQEVVSNIVRHSGATKARIDVSRHEHHVEMRMEDDGKGFDVQERLAKGSARRGFGLSSIAERVKLIGGMLDITSNSNRGTIVSINIPLPSS